ncbi:hypothetical protein BST61_g10044 [Cercospora zeina]
MANEADNTTTTMSTDLIPAATAAAPALSSRPQRERKRNRRYSSTTFETEIAVVSLNASSLRPTNANYAGKGKGKGESNSVQTTTSQSKKPRTEPRPQPLPDLLPVPRPVPENAIPGTNPPRAPTSAWTLPTAVSGVDSEIVFAAASLMLMREEGQEVLDAFRAKNDQPWLEGWEGEGAERGGGAVGEGEKRERYEGFLEGENKRKATERLAKYWM